MHSISNNELREHPERDDDVDDDGAASPPR